MDAHSGNVAVVTGAGGGIGRAMASALVASGAETWLVGRTAATLGETARTCGPGTTRVHAADLTRTQDVDALLGELEREAGRVDVFVHAAGVIAHGRVEDLSVEDLDRQYAANIRAFYVLAQRLLPLLRQGPGEIVVVNSSIVSGPRAATGQFAATQHALRALTDTLRQEVNEDGIRVLSVFPGRTATSRQERLYAEEGRSYRPEVLLQPEDLAAIVLSALALPRTAEVTDIQIRPMLKSY
ncbi:MAG: SDR family oxidoreductase [Gaiellaceae bacterium]|jgi:NADP-dependent 3-hydroxy acid dehydrogenase YdfG